MKKISDTIFVCNSCGNEFSKWSGQCGFCKEWNSLKEAPNYKSTISKQFPKNKLQITKVKNLGEIGIEKKEFENVFSSQISEFDRVLGKGIVRGSVRSEEHTSELQSR